MTSILSSTSASNRRGLGSVVRTGAGLVLGLVLAVLVLELALRLMVVSPWWRVLPAVSAQFDAPDPDIGYAHRPNVEGLWLREHRAFVRINAQGLRDRARTQQPAPGTLRIAVAGDSVTEALQVDEHDLFTLRTERALQGNGLPVEVLNFGLSGAMPLQQLLLLEKRGLPIGIAAGVMIFTGRNFVSPMMADDSTIPAYVENPSGQLAVGRAYRDRRSHRWADQWQGRVFFWLVDHSLVADMLYVRATLNTAKGAPAVALDAAPVGDCANETKALEDLERLFGAAEPKWAARRLDRFLADINTGLAGRPTILMLNGFGRSPECPQLEPLHQSAVKHAQAKFQAAGIGFVDLDTAIRSKLPSPDDDRRMIGFGSRIGHGHLNPFGHEIYSEILTDALLPTIDRLREAHVTHPPQQ
jgi:hypothetical protein